MERRSRTWSFVRKLGCNERRPSGWREIAPQSFGRFSGVAELAEAERIATFGETASLFVEHKRTVIEGRRLDAEGIEE